MKAISRNLKSQYFGDIICVCGEIVNVLDCWKRERKKYDLLHIEFES